MVTNVFMEGNILWVATADAGMGRFDGQDWIVYNNNNSGLPSNWVYMIKMDSYNNKWIATFFGGVAKFNFSQNLWTVYNTGNSGLHDNNTFSIYVDNNNVKWIGASGCARYNDTNWQIFLYSFIGDVFNFAKDKYGNMWICTTRGLYVYNPTGVIGINNNTSVISDNFDLFQNYPNPFNSISKIKYQLSNIQIKNQKVKLIIFNSIGQKLMTLVDKVQTPGIYEISFDGSNLASGIYFYQLQVNDFMQVKKMVFLK
jgi:ligand-binding sensor domain-containing protein